MADSSHNDVVVDDVVDDVFVDSDAVVLVEGVFDIDVGTPGHAKHRTMLASQHALSLAYWQPASPQSPYDVQPIFVLYTPMGAYGFSDKGVPQGIEDQLLTFDTTLADVEPLSFRAVPIDGNLLGSMSKIERSQGRITINDPTGVWARKISTEAIVGMPAGLFWMIRRLYTEPALSGTIGRLRYLNRQLVLEYGDFKRDF